MATISENLQSLKTVKQNIRAELEKKGVDMMSVPFSSYASKISEISVGTNDKPTEGKSAIIVYAKNNLGEVVTNVTITITGGGNTYTAISDNNGRVFQEVDAGTYTVSVGNKEMHVAPDSQSVVAEVNETKYVYMIYTVTTLTVIVKKEDGTAVVGANVSIDGILAGATNESGTFSQVISVGEHTVQMGAIDGEYYTPEPQTITTTLGQNSIVTMTYNRIKTALVIYAMDNGGKAIVGAEVSVTGDGTYSGITDDTGLYYVEVPAGSYTISVNDLSGYTTPESQSVSVVYGQELEVDMVYVVAISRVFGENNWSTISNISAEISTNNMTSAQVEETYGWKPGDLKSETLSTGEVIELQIIGFNHDDKSDETGKAGITLQMKNCLSVKYQMEAHYSTDAKNGWGSTQMRNKTFPVIKSTLPQDLQDVIVLVNKKYYKKSIGVATATDDLFLLDEIELFGSKVVENSQAYGLVYEYWENKTSNDRIKNVGAKASRWWLRSYESKWSTYVNVAATGDAESGSSTNTEMGVSFALCV